MSWPNFTAEETGSAATRSILCQYNLKLKWQRQNSNPGEIVRKWKTHSASWRVDQEEILHKPASEYESVGSFSEGQKERDSNIMKQHKVGMIPERSPGPQADGANDMGEQSGRPTRPRLREQDAAKQGANGVSVQNKTWDMGSNHSPSSDPQGPAKALAGNRSPQTVRHIHYLKTLSTLLCASLFLMPEI